METNTDYIELTWADTGRKRWVHRDHLIWFAESPAEEGSDERGVAFVTGDGVGGTDWLGCRETPQEIMEAINRLPSRCNYSGSERSAPDQPHSD